MRFRDVLIALLDHLATILVLAIVVTMLLVVRQPAPRPETVVLHHGNVYHLDAQTLRESLGSGD